MEEVFKKLLKNESGALSSLEDLKNYEKKFLYVLIHLPLKENDTSAQNKDTYSRSKEVIATLTNFIESGGSPINKKKERVMNVIHQHIQSNNDNNKTG